MAVVMRMDYKNYTCLFFCSEVTVFHTFFFFFFFKAKQEAMAYLIKYFLLSDVFPSCNKTTLSFRLL